MMSNNQHTINDPTSISGVGLHTGKEVTMTFKPAPIDHGFKFKRVDMDEQPVIDADIDNVVDVSRGTTLKQNGAMVVTVEHALAALVGLEVDNVLIELDGQEIPIMDGSANEFVDVLMQTGLKEQEAERNYIELDTNISFEDDDKNVEMLAVPNDEFKVTVMIDFNSPILGTQHASIESIKDFKEELAASRTFCFLHELEELLDQNLIKGGDLNNAIVVVDKVVDNDELNRLAKVFQREDVEVKNEGILNNVQLRQTNEPARHKLLDVIGDLALLGAPIKGKIFGQRPGHATNIEFAKKIRQHLKKTNRKSKAPIYDPELPPVYDIRMIADSLPHKYPFLLVDKIVELTENRVVGVKNVTYNEHFFQGHFPGNPVMPGVLQLESLVQTGGVLALNTVTNPEQYDTYFLMIHKAKFKNRVVPGDTLILQLDLQEPIRRGICEMKGTAYVGDKVASEAELVAKIVRKEDR